VEKANKRSGGVGTEAQIITPEVYGAQDQSKFVAVIKERDENGNPYVPVYYKSRIYIDLSEASTYEENFEQLTRWIYNQPLYRRPQLGQKPAFLSETANSVHLPTSAAYRRALDGIKSGRNYAIPALVEYFSVVSKGMEEFRISYSDKQPFDEKLISSIEAFMPYRNELISMFLTISLYRDDEEVRQCVHRFFESLIPYMDRPPEVQQWSSWNFDNYKFIVHELFLYCISAFIQNNRFDAAAYMLSTDYYVEAHPERGRAAMVSFTTFWQYTESLTARNLRLKARRLSLRADLLLARSKGGGVEWRTLMAADFVMFMRSKIHVRGDLDIWRPETLLFVGRANNHFEIFARAKSAAFFEKMKVLLGINKKMDLEPILQSLETVQGSIPRWEFDSFNPRALLGFDALQTTP